MRENPGVEVVHRFFRGTGATYDFMVNLCTLGFDGSWKKKILAGIPRGSVRVMDQACGTGILTLKIARELPGGQVVGVELLDEYLAIAKEKTKDLAFNNIEFILGRAEEVLLDESFDCITSSYLAKYADLNALVQNMRKMLRPGGVLIMHDFTYPSSRIFVQIWKLYFKFLQTIGSWKYPQWRTIFYGLPELLQETKWTTELIQFLRENGFSDIHIQPLTFGTSTIVTATKR